MSGRRTAARLAVVAHVEHLREERGISTRAAVAEVCALAARGGLPRRLQAAAREAKARNRATPLAPQTLADWVTKKANGGRGALVPCDRGRGEPPWGEALLALRHQQPRRRLTRVLAELQATLPAGLPQPSYGQAKRFLKKAKEASNSGRPDADAGGIRDAKTREAMAQVAAAMREIEATLAAAAPAIARLEALAGAGDVN